MASTARQPQVPAPVPAAPTTNSPIVNIKLPETFNGDRTTFTSFMQDCYVHILHHKAAFDDDDKKIIFTLSLINGGTARAWKENWLAKKITAGSLGTYEALKGDLTATFTQIDEGGHARALLKSMRQKKGTLNEYINEFQIQAGRSNIDSEKALEEYFMEGIQPDILKDIFRLGTLPKNMQEWFTQTARIELQQIRLQEIENRRKGITTSHHGHYGYNNNNSSGRTRDPNAMDVDRLSTKEVERYKKENRCFNCHETGHISRFCRNKNKRRAESKPQDNWRNRNDNKPQDNKRNKFKNNMIRKILTVLDEEEEDNEEQKSRDDRKEDKKVEEKEGKEQDF
jgi:hypothetical protein